MKRPFLASALSMALVVTGSTTAFAGDPPDAGARQCKAWLKRTLDTVESSRMDRRRDLVILATRQSCPGVADALKAAGASYAKASPEKTRAQILANGAAAVLKENCAKCSVADPLAPAGPLVVECPLPGPDDQGDPEVLGGMRAADYVFLNALMTSLLAAGEYDRTAYRIALDFILSAAQLAERKAGSREQAAKQKGKGK